MTFPERIDTARLTARKPVLADGHPWATILAAPEIDEAAWPAHQRSPDDVRASVGRTIAHWDAHGFGAWTVLEQGSDTVIGRVGMRYDIKEGRAAVDVGWWIAARHWGRGYATEAAAEAVRQARDALGFVELHGWTTPANVASQRVMARLGFVRQREVVHAGLPHILYRWSA